MKDPRPKPRERIPNQPEQSIDWIEVGLCAYERSLNALEAGDHKLSHREWESWQMALELSGKCPF
jgi:hypothetical protein